MLYSPRAACYKRPVVVVITTGDGSTGDGSTDAPALESSSSSGGSEPDTSPADTAVEPSCGNAIVEAGETCDDAGESATCDDDCTPVDCGDGVVNEAAGEQQGQALAEQMMSAAIDSCGVELPDAG